jgi:hypothetical protein
MKKIPHCGNNSKSNRNFVWPSGSVIWKEIIRGKIDTSNTQIHHRRSWHVLTTHLFSNFLLTNIFSIKFLYFFNISALFPYFNWCICVLEVSILPLIISFHITLPLGQTKFLLDLELFPQCGIFFISHDRDHSAKGLSDFSIAFWSCFSVWYFFFSFYYSTIRYLHDSLIAKTYWPVITRSMCKIIRNKA